VQPQDQLASLLSKVNADALREFAIEPGTPPHQLVEASRPSASEGTRAGQLPSDFLQQLRHAVSQLREGRNPDQFRTLRLQCHGCGTVFSEDGVGLIGDLPALTRLLALADGYRGDGYRFRRLFDGLLRAYLAVDRQGKWFASQHAQHGNEVLRIYLEGTFDTIRKLEPTPDWVPTLQAYPEVLSADPGLRFAKDWLTGGGIEFQDLSRRLGLTDASWLAVETLRSALSTAVAMDDRQFVTHLKPLLTAAAEPRFRTLRDDIYAELLARYTGLHSAPVHAELRDAVVAAWKNPWLARNDSAWARVSDPARKMVAGWLKLDLIHQFFEVLSEDGKQDRSRFEFWRRYHEAMDDVYFALGSRAYTSRQPDLIKLRNALEGRLLELVGTEADNNAFIMCMGNDVVVEFSKKGNAAHRHPRGKLNFDGARRSIGIGELRQESTQRLIHRDTREEEWQERFAKTLRHRPTPATAPGAASAPTIHQLRAAAPHNVRGSLATAQDISAFARANGIRIEDHRSKGGTLWLIASNEDPDINRQLTSWGFKHRPGRGWWSAEQ